MFETIVVIILIILVVLLNQVINLIKEHKELIPKKSVEQDIEKWEEEDWKWKMERGQSIDDYLPNEVEVNIENMKRKYYNAQYKTFRTPQFPIFTEAELAWQDLLIERCHAEYWGFKDILNKEVCKEIKEHEAGGKKKTTFKPSNHIEQLLRAEMNAAKKVEPYTNIRNCMIESNIAVINGKSINEAYKIYESKTRKISTFGLNIGEKANKEIQDDLKELMKSWLEKWDDIVVSEDER